MAIGVLDKTYINVGPLGISDAVFLRLGERAESAAEGGLSLPEVAASLDLLVGDALKPRLHEEPVFGGSLGIGMRRLDDREPSSPRLGLPMNRPMSLTV